jgi:Protein of unknown function (DUF3800)
MDIDAVRGYISELALRSGLADPVPNMPDFDHHPLHVVDTIYFGDSHESLALQLADVCCATISQHLSGNPDAEPFYSLIRSQIVTDDTFVEFSNAWKENIAKRQQP